VENWFLNVPGLKIAVPATPADAYGLLRAAVRDPDPVLVFEHKHLLGNEGEIAEEPKPIELGVADVVRSGDDVTVVATQWMRLRVEEAAERLAGEGVSVEVIDPRTVAPFDYDTVGKSLDRTNRLVVVQECSNDGSWGATVVSRLMADHFESFDAPPMLVGGDETPIPYSGVLEEYWLPSVDRIVDSIRRSLDY
jgi:acetoin:2,6-dichlorophenolindophenol oxidoreductase subunit beta